MYPSYQLNIISMLAALVEMVALLYIRKENVRKCLYCKRGNFSVGEIFAYFAFGNFTRIYPPHEYFNIVLQASFENSRI